MGTSGMNGESTGEESGREPVGPAGESSPRRRRPGRRVLRRVVAAFAIYVVEAVVSVWAPEWSDVAQALTTALRVAVRLYRGRSGRPRA